MNTQDAPSTGQMYFGKEEIEIGGQQLLIEFQYSISEEGDDSSANEFSFSKASLMISISVLAVNWLDITDLCIELNDDFGNVVYDALTSSQSQFQFVANNNLVP